LAISRPIVVITCIIASSESWGPYQRPHPWHSRAGGGADWIGNNWALLFSHPKDFTPVCTTELGALAKLKPEFDKRGFKLMGLSVDPVDAHTKWSEDIKETQGAAPNYPMIGDSDFKVSKLYEMLPASTSGDAATRTPADNQTVRNVMVIGPDKKIKLVMVYPMTTARP